MQLRQIWTVCGVLLFGAVLALRAFQVSDPLARAARQFDRQLRDQVMPYWFDNTQDKTNGGYALGGETKTLLSQSRMVWGFSHAHRLGYSSARRNYLSAADQGVRFISKHFRDRTHGGFYWETANDGRVIDTRKVTLGHAFLLFALVEYYRANKDPKILREAKRVFQTLQIRARDQSAGWLEIFNVGWSPEYSGINQPQLGTPGNKSANVHLHLMEALTELYSETKDSDVRAALEESIRINQTYFFPNDPQAVATAFTPDWKNSVETGAQLITYGHNVEFAWLLQRAQEVLGQPQDAAILQRYLNHALANGFDQRDGGLYLKGTRSAVTDSEKVWWPQAELLAAMTYALKLPDNQEYREAAIKEIEFLNAVIIDPQDGIWFWSLKADGKINPLKASNWKMNYHDVRAMTMWVQAFG